MEQVYTQDVSRKKTIVLLNGLLGDESFWNYQVKELAKIGEIIIPEYSIYSTLTEAAKHLLAQLPDHFSIIGFSLGGNLALELYRQAKNRVESMILISTGSLPIHDEIKTRLIADRENIKKCDANFNQFVKSCGERFFHKYEQPELFNEFVSSGLSQGKEKCLNQMNMLFEEPAEINIIDCPGLIIYGEKDKILPMNRIHEVADLFRSREIASVSNAAHFLSWENPLAVNELLLSWYERHQIKEMLGFEIK